jgi:hypothetical protein
MFCFGIHDIVLFCANVDQADHRANAEGHRFSFAVVGVARCSVSMVAS